MVGGYLVLNRGMTPDAVVEHLNVLKHNLPCMITGLKFEVMQAFSFERAEEASRADRPAYCALPSHRSVSNHAVRPDTAFSPKGTLRHYSVSGCFRASPWNRRLAAALRRIEFVILRADSSPPLAPHLASRRRSYLRLPGCGILRHGLAPC